MSAPWRRLLTLLRALNDNYSWRHWLRALRRGHWLQGPLRRSPRPSPRPRSYRPQIEPLEGLILPSTSPLTVFGTGLTSSGGLLADGVADSHYQLVSVPSPDTTGAGIVANEGTFPFPAWLADGPSSKWIAPHANENDKLTGGVSEPVGNYTYQTTFSLTGFNPQTAVLTGAVAADNTLSAILLNGVNVGFASYSSYSTLKAFTISAGFVAGTNTLQFVVVNGAGTTQNPSGLRVNLSGTAQTQSGTAFPVYGTGQNTSGGLLTSGATDPHYQITAAPSPDTPGSALVANTTTWPFPVWVADGPTSAWIAPHANQNQNDAVGSYTYQTTFDLTGFDPTTAFLAGKVAADNTLTSILLNGQSTGYTSDNANDYGSFHAFSISSGFVSGVNTLQFVLSNAAPTSSPNSTGLRVDLSGSASVATTTTLAVSNTTPTYGQSITLTASVASGVSGAGTPGGTVSFLDGTTTLGTATLNGSDVATFNIASLAAGSHALTAVYVGSSPFGGSISTPATVVTVGQANTTTTLTSSASPITYGTAVTLTSTVAPVAPGSGNPSGSVTFYDGATALGSGTLSLSGGVMTASLTTTHINAGNRTLTAVYAGDTNFVGSTSSNLTQVVQQATLTVSGITANNKTYDDGTTATLNFSNEHLVGVQSGDSVTLNTSGYSASFASKDVASGIAVTVSGLSLSGAQASDYTLTPPTGFSAAITPLSINVTGITAESKTYDSTIVATLDFSGEQLQTVFSGDSVTLNSSSYSASFASKDVASSNAITVSGLALSGAQANDYTLTPPTGLSAAITPLSINVTGIIANNKTYDSTTAATLDFSGEQLQTVFGGDSVSLNTSGYSASFASKDVATGIAVTVSGLALSGAQANDYTLTPPTGFSAAITVRSLTITASNFVMTYADGTTIADITGFSSAGLQGSDAVNSVTLTTNASFSSSSNWQAGSWNITPSAATGTPFNADNYSITYVNGILTINTKDLFVTGVSGTDKTYDGGISDPISGTASLSSDLVAGDSVTLDASHASASFTDKNVGTNKPVTFAGYTISGADAGNYHLVQPTSTATITQVNQAPVGTNDTVTTLEHTSYSFGAADFGFTDPHNSPANHFKAVEISTLPAAGALTDHGTAVTAGQFVPASDLAASRLVFTPATYASGNNYASFTFKVQDDGGTVNGGVDTDTTARTMTINVTRVNQAPQGTPETITLPTPSSYVFGTSDFGFSDPHDNPVNKLKAVTIDTLPTSGVLTDSDVPVAANASVTAADLSAGSLVYTPKAITLTNTDAQTNYAGDLVNLMLSGSSSVGDPVTYLALNLPAGLTLDSATGVISGTLAASTAASSPYTVTVVAQDASANLSTGEQFTWTVQPDIIQFSGPGTQTNLVGDSINLILQGDDNAGHTLTYSASNLPAELSLDGTTGVLSGTVSASAGATLVSVTASDGTVSNTQVFPWIVQASTPTTGTVSLSSPGTQRNLDGDVVNLAVSASDSAGNPLTFSASGLPTGLSIDSSSGIISGAINSAADASSPYLVSITASDGVSGDSATQYAVWSVAPVPTPTPAPAAVVSLVNPGMPANQVGDSLSLSLYGGDSANHALSYAASGLPGGMTIDSSTGFISGTLAASGAFTVTVTATDSTAGVSNSQQFLWLVQPKFADGFTFQVQDDGGTANGGHDTDPTARTLTFQSGPNAVNDAGFSTTQNVPLAIAGASLLANDTDPAGNALTIIDNSQPANGTVTYDGSTFTYTPATDFSGVDQFTYTISDGQGNHATATVFLQVQSLPVAKDDWYYPRTNQSMTLKVLQNDSDANGAALTITSITAATNGTATLAADGLSVAYTPNTDFTGQDSFTYTITDGMGNTSTATVHLSIGNGEWASSILGDSSEWTDSGPYDWYAVQALGTPNTFDYGSSFGDITTAWAPEAENGTQETLSLGFATLDYAKGVLVRETYGNGFVTQIDLQDSTGAWHDAVWTGTDNSQPGNPVDFLVSFPLTTYQVQGVRIDVNTDHDQNAWEEIDAVQLMTATVNAIPSDTPVILNAPATASVNEDTSTTDTDSSVNIPISSLVSDPNGYPLILTITSAPANGDVEVNDNGTPDNLSDDYLTYTPDPLFNGSDPFTYQVASIYGATASGTVNVTVNPVNHAPDATGDFAVADENTPTTINVLNDGSTDDPDGDLLTVSIASAPANGTATANSDGTITYTPATGFTGIDYLTYAVADGRGGTASARVAITVYPTGEWASSVVSASSQYDPGDGSPDWAATQALGAPDTFAYGDSSTAWAPSTLDSSTESLTVGFATPTAATGVIVRETDGNGFVTQIELQDTSGIWHTAWTGTDPATQGKATDLILSFPVTSYDVQAVRISADTTLDPNDYAEIDAVRLVTAGNPTTTSISTQAVNQLPVASPVWTSTQVGTAMAIPVLANASDPDGDTLSVQSVGTPADGTATINSDGTITYTPTTGYSGPDSFTFTISDSCGGTATSTVYVTVANGQYASSVLGFSSQSNDGTYGTSVWALGPADTMAYGDTSKSWSPNSSSTATSESLTLGIASPDYANGVLVRESSGNGCVTEIDLQDTSGVWYTAWTGTDSTPAGNVQNFVVNFATTAYQVQAVKVVVNPTTADGDPVGIDAVELLTASAPPAPPAAPVAAADNATTAENMPVNIPVLANDADSAGSQLYLRITSDPANGTAAIDLHGAPNDSSVAFINYTPYADYSGPDSFTYSITDAYGQTSSATVSITVSAVNQPPVAGSTSAVITAGASTTLNVLANATDPDSDTLTVSSITQGENGTATLNSDGSVTYTPNSGFTGEDEFTYAISDGHGHTSIGTAQVTVYGAGQWASTVLAYSSGADSTASALGVPDDTAWTPDGTTQLDFLTVGFSTPASATGVLVREEGGGGNVTMVQLIDDTGASHTIWSGSDPTSGTSPVDFYVNFPATSYNVAAVQIFVSNANSDASIDAVRLLTGGAPSSVTVSAQGFDSNGNYDNTTYNSAGQPITVLTYTQGILTQTVANTYSAGVLSATITTDATGNATEDTYDANGNKLSETDGYGSSAASTTDYAYDAQNRMTSLTDPKGNETTWTYSTSQTVQTNPNGSTDTKSYNSQDQLTSELNPNDLLTTYAYDDNNNLTTETEYAGATTASSVVDTLDWTYTPSGQVATAGNNAGTYAFTFDDQGRVIQVEEPFGVTLTFGYDQYGNRNLVKDSLGGEEDSLYNANGQLLSRVLTQGDQTLRIEFTYDVLGRVATETRYSDAAGTALMAATTYTYDAFGNVTSIIDKDASNTTIDEFDYAYDAAGQELASETDLQPALSATPQTTDYTYDTQGELTGAGSTDYSYDSNGNRNTSGYTYATGNTNEITSDGTWDYTYDAAGNETSKVNIATGEKWTYAYDNRNELTQALHYNTSGVQDEEADYTYDVYGNRIEKNVYGVFMSTQDVRYALDGWDPAKPTPTGNENFDVLAEMDGSNALTTRYLHGDGVDQLLGRVDTSGASDPAGTYWTLTDHLGSVRDVINNSGSVKDALAYDAYGNITSESNATDRGNYAWTGREIDVETGLQYNRARYYDATTGRWISQDSMGFDAGDSNLYRYVNNQPSNALDPSGLQLQGGTQAQENYDKAWALFKASKTAMAEFEKAKTIQGKAKPLVIVVDTDLPSVGAYSSKAGKIYINPIHPDVKDTDSLASTMLFETLNAQKRTSFNLIIKQATMGQLSRADYVLLHEKIEFDNSQIHVGLMKTIRKNDGWGASADHYVTTDFETFLRFLTKEAPSHLQGPARAWNILFKKSWSTAHPNLNLDTITAPLIKSLNLSKQTTDNLEKILKLAPDK